MNIDYDKIMRGVTDTDISEDLQLSFTLNPDIQIVKKCMKKAIKEAIPIILEEFKDKAEVDCELFGDAQYAEKDQIEVYFLNGSIDNIAQNLIKQL